MTEFADNISNIKKIKLLNPLTNSFRSWLICLATALYFLYDFIQMQMFNVLGSYIQRDFSLNTEEFASLGSMFLLADVIFLFPAGVLLDRVSIRKATIITLILSILGAFGFATASSYEVAILSRFSAGVAHAFCFLCCMILATRWFSPEKRSLVIGIMVTLGLTGGLIAQTPLTHLVEYLGDWRMAIMWDVGLGIVVLSLIMMFVKDHPEDRTYSFGNNEKFKLIGFLQNVKEASSNQVNWLLGLYTGFMNLPVMIIGGLFGVSYFTQAHNMTSFDASKITSMIFLGTIIGSPLMGWLSDYIKDSRKLMLYMSFISFILFGMLYFFSMTQTQYLILFFTLGVVTSAQILSYPSITVSNSHKISGTALGLASCIIMGLGSMGIALTGKILYIFGNASVVNDVEMYSIMDYNYAFSIMLFGFIIAWLCAYKFNQKSIIYKGD